MKNTLDFIRCALADTLLEFAQFLYPKDSQERRQLAAMNLVEKRTDADISFEGRL
jgi:hypothetical protein